MAASLYQNKQVSWRTVPDLWLAGDHFVGKRQIEVSIKDYNIIL